MNVDQKIVTELIKLYKAYQTETPQDLTSTHSFAGFMYWLEQKYLKAVL